MLDRPPQEEIDRVKGWLREQECQTQGHDFEVIGQSLGQPTALVCGRCGESWSVVPQSKGPNAEGA